MAQDTFGVECPTCKHVSYYDTRRVCTDDGSVVRRVIFRTNEGKKLHKIYLKCTRHGCDGEVEVDVDCEAYK
jgi:hypothetical protein